MDDPLTTAILTAASAGVAAGATKATQQGVLDAYQAIKGLLKRKFGAHSDLMNAVKSIEADPNSTALKQVLREEVIATHAYEDLELAHAASTLLECLNNDLTHNSQTIIGDENIQLSGHHQKINVKKSN